MALLLVSLPSCCTQPTGPHNELVIAFQHQCNDNPHQRDKHVTWNLTSKDGTDAFINYIMHTNTIIWECTTNFSIVVPNPANWRIQTAEPPMWRTNVCTCQFGANYGVVNSTTGTNAQVVLMFLPTNHETLTYHIAIPPVRSLNEVSALGATTNYNDNLVEATLAPDDGLNNARQK